MKPLNWVVLAMLTVCSVAFIALYFLLGFNTIDWLDGMVLAVIWWIAIIAVGVAIHLQKRHFEKQDENGRAQAEGSATSKRSARAAEGSVGTAVIVAILVPTLAFSTFSVASFASADEPASATRTTSDHNDPWFYKLSSDSDGIDLFYSVAGAPLVQLQPGEVLEESHQIPVEFFVRPKAGYLVDSTFKHSGNEYGFVAPNSNGVYSPVGTNELPGFDDAVKEALEMGCTKEFHYSFVEGAPWRYYIYREFQITVKPFGVTAQFDLDGGTLDGSTTYDDANIYYGSQVEGHADQYLIALPTEEPQREGYVFAGWMVGEQADLLPAGSQVNIEDHWRYLYDHSTSEGASLPIVAQWKEEASEVPDDTAGDAGDSSASGGSAGSGSSDSDGTISGAGSDDASDSATTTPGDSDQDGTTGSDESDGDADDEGKGVTGGATGVSGGSSSSAGGMAAGSSTPVAPSEATGADSPDGTSSGSDNSTSSEGSHPMTGDVAHGALLNANQVTPGTADADAPFADGVNATAKALRNGLHSVEEAITDDPVALSFGISYANRGCWVCDYLKVGIALSLLYGAVVLIYRAVRHTRKSSGASNEGSSTTAAAASA